METEYTGLYKLGNTSETGRAVSLHVYSPPCGSASNKHVQVHTPSPAHKSESGIVRAQMFTAAMRPAAEVRLSCRTYCHWCGTRAAVRAAGSGVASGGASNDGARRAGGQQEAPENVSLTLSDSSAQLKLEMQAFGVIYTDFQSCASFLKSELNPNDVKATSAMMQGFDFHPEEWQQYSNYQAVFADNPQSAGRNQALIVRRQICVGTDRWDAKHTAHRSTTGSKCWIKVLDGRLEENHFNVEVTRAGRCYTWGCGWSWHRCRSPGWQRVSPARRQQWRKLCAGP